MANDGILMEKMLKALFHSFFLSAISLSICLADEQVTDDLTDQATDAVKEAISKASDEIDKAVSKEEAVGDSVSIYVIPVKSAIGKPTLFSIRGGLKEAIELGADAVILDMDTPGGELGVTLEIMKALDKFPGRTITYINEEATSAGAIIASVTKEIRFAPKATMGSAEPVTGQGQDIDESMKRKVISYMKAKIRAYTEQYPYRGDVLNAMVDPESELKIGEEVIKAKGELLNLTASEAHKEYGDPPVPLLGSGIHDTIEDLVKELGGSETVKRVDYEITWSLKLAEWLMLLNPILLGIAGWLLFAEFQTQGFGLYFGIAIGLVAIVFFGHHVAGLSGHEELLIFVAGAAMVLIEMLFMPGILVLAIPGILLMIGSLLWGMADIWPAESPNFEFTLDLFFNPLLNLFLAAVFALFLLFAFLKFMPRSFVLDRLVLNKSIQANTQDDETNVGGAPDQDEPQAGDIATVVTDLYPSGEIEIKGQRYEAHIEVGSAEKGDQVRITGKGNFGFLVEEMKG